MQDEIVGMTVSIQSQFEKKKKKKKTEWLLVNWSGKWGWEFKGNSARQRIVTKKVVESELENEREGECAIVAMSEITEGR